jgi:hypothetical protein
MSDFVEVFADFLGHTVTVEPYEGDGAFGVGYGSPTEVSSVMVEHVDRMVRTSTGDELQSNTRLYVPLEAAEDFPLESRVTLPSGRRHTVAQTDSFQVYGLPEHVVVYLV